MKEYPLTKGKFAKIDDDFFDYCLQNSLRFHFLDQGEKCNHRGYAMHEGRLGKIRMHQLVMRFHGVDVPSGMDIDHIDGDRLNNQFENLQILTRTQNLLKKDRHYPNETGYLGVQRRKDGRSSGTRYRAWVEYEGKKYNGGSHASPEEAARARDRLAKELQGEFANLNFPT